MALGDRLGLVGVILALLGIAFTYLWPDKKWIGWISLSMAVLLVGTWGWLEFKPQLVGFYQDNPIKSTALVFLCGGLFSAGMWLWITSPNKSGSKPSKSAIAETAEDSPPSFLFVFGAPFGENDSPVWMMMLKHYGPDAVYNCDIVFVDEDRKNIEHQWLVEHPESSFLPVGGVAGKSQKSFHIPEAAREGAPLKFQWSPVDPNNQHYTVSISCRDGYFVEHWEVTRVDGVLRTKIAIEHGPQWVENNPMRSPIVFNCTQPGFLSTPLASALPNTAPPPVNPGWKANHKFDFPVAILDPNGNVQVLAGVRLPDGSQKTDFGCWNMLTKHFGDNP